MDKVTSGFIVFLRMGDNLSNRPMLPLLHFFNINDIKEQNKDENSNNFQISEASMCRKTTIRTLLSAG